MNFCRITYLYTRLDAIKRASNNKKSQQSLSNLEPFENATYFHPCNEVCLQYVWNGFTTELKLRESEVSASSWFSGGRGLSILFRLSSFVILGMVRDELDSIRNSCDVLYVLHNLHVLQSLTAGFHNLWSPAPDCLNTEIHLSPIYFYLFNGRVLVYQLFQQVSTLQTDVKFGNTYFIAYWARQMTVLIIFGDIRWMGQ